MILMGLETEHIFDTYTKEVRSILELAVPVWHSSLTKKLSSDIERIQRIAFRIILGDDYSNYEVACTILATETIEMRREKLCLKFSKNDVKSKKTLFNVVLDPSRTRATGKVVQEFKCNTKRFQNSALPYLPKLLNQQ